MKHLARELKSFRFGHSVAITITVKIASQMMNTMPEATSTLSVADVSKGSLQSSFAAVIGATAAAAPTNGDAKLAKVQNVDTKKTSAPESAKKSSNSSTDDAIVVPQLAHSSIEPDLALAQIAQPVAPQPVLPQTGVLVVKGNVTSGNAPEAVTASASEALSMTSATGALATTVADSRSVPTAPSKVQDNSKATTNTLLVGTATAPSTSKVDATVVQPAGPIPSPVHAVNAGNAPVDASAALPTKVGAEAIRLPNSNLAVSNSVESGSVVARPAHTSVAPAELTNSLVTLAPTNRVDAIPTNTVTATPTNRVDATSTNSGTAIPTSTVPAIPTNVAPAAPTNVAPAAPTNSVTATPMNSASAIPMNGVPSIPTSNVKVDSDSAKTRVQVSSDVVAVQQNVPSLVTTPVLTTVLPPIVNQSARHQSVSEGAIASSASASSSIAPAISTNVGSVATTSSSVAAFPLKSTDQTANIPHVQSSGTGNTASTSALAQPLAATQQGTAPQVTKTQADANVASTPQPAEVSIAAVTQQAGQITLTAPQQSADVTASSSSAASFKVPEGKSEAVGTSGGSSIGSKGRASATDWRLNRNSSTSDDKSSSVGAVGGAIAPRVVVAEAGSQATPGNRSAEDIGAANVKGAQDSAALAQNVQGAQAVSTPAPSAPVAATPDSSATANTALPVAVAPADGTHATQALNSAQLIQSVHGSEMRLGMQSAEFGNISINTSLNHQILSAQISMDHSALGNAMAMHLPAIEERLGSAYGLQAKVELRDTGASSTASDSSSSQSSGDRRSQGGSSGRPSTGLQSSIGALTSSNFTSTSTSMAAVSSRLDIRI